ncbi:TPA: hypothetical protein DDW35_06795, partial [Candidatus Sumerlaeota bacterium]|nr:hypothetical protein [Candidatus Sumerlaeota bacterium]
MDQQTLVQKVRGLWDLYEPIYQEFTPYPLYFEVRSVEFLLLTLRLRQQFPTLHWNHVLEVGCGCGFSLQLWNLLADEVSGVDQPGVIPTAEKLAARHPENRERVHLFGGAGEDLSMLAGQRFDLVVTQYAFEHFQSMERALEQIHGVLAPGGCAVHVLPNITDRHAWHIIYRTETSWWRRLRESWRRRGKKATLMNPFTYTPPHDPTRGDFEGEHANY